MVPVSLYPELMRIQRLKSSVDRLLLEERASLATCFLQSLDAPTYDVTDEAVRRPMEDSRVKRVLEIDHETLVKALNLRYSASK